jgi:hypothetical protein
VGPVEVVGDTVAVELTGALLGERLERRPLVRQLLPAVGPQAERLSDETGARAGVAFGYQGSPSWLFLTIDPEHRGDVKSAELVTKDGRKITIPQLRLDRGGTWGGAIPTDLYSVQSVRLLGDSPGDVLQASVPAGPEGD